MGTKIVKGYWKCEYCGTYDIDGLIDNCPNCGKQKSHNIKDYMKSGGELSLGYPTDACEGRQGSASS